MAQIIKSNAFSVKDIKCENVCKNKAGGNIVYLKYKDHKRIVIQTPQMSAPFGLSTYTDDNTGISKYSIDLSFKDKDSDSKVKHYHDIITELDEFMVSKAVDNSKEWFGKKMSKEVVEELYRPLIKESKDPSKYASTIKYKIRSIGEKMNLEAFDENKNIFDMSNFGPGSKVRCLIELSSIWFVNKQFGCTFTIVQIQVSKPERIQGFSFESDDDDDEEDDDEEDDEEDNEEDNESNVSEN